MEGLLGVVTVHITGQRRGGWDGGLMSKRLEPHSFFVRRKERMEIFPWPTYPKALLQRKSNIVDGKRKKKCQVGGEAQLRPHDGTSILSSQPPFYDAKDAALLRGGGGGVFVLAYSMIIVERRHLLLLHSCKRWKGRGEKRWGLQRVSYIEKRRVAFSLGHGDTRRRLIGS